MMHLLVSNDSGHMAKPRAAGPFDVTEHARTHAFLKILAQALLHVPTHTHTHTPSSRTPTDTYTLTHMHSHTAMYWAAVHSGPPLVLWWLVLMSLPNDLARVER